MGENSNIEWVETGRSVASNGYVLIRVGTDHPLADVRGYAYEHRLVASRALGRWLESHEIVHHKNEDKTDNSPGNLKVVAGNAEHGVEHRKRADLRLPGQPNEIIGCACGCGRRFREFDKSGRPRAFASGHNPQPSEVRELILGILVHSGAASSSELVRRTGKTPSAIKTIMWRLKKRGLVRKLARGFWVARSERIEHVAEGQREMSRRSPDSILLDTIEAADPGDQFPEVAVG